MPAALEVDHDQVKCIAIQVGYREAARQLGLSEATVCYWAVKEGWSEQVKQVQQAVDVVKERQGVHALPSGSSVLAKLAGKSKLLGAKVGHETLKSIYQHKGTPKLPMYAGAYASTVNALSKIHQWDQPAAGSTVNVQLLNQVVVPPVQPRDSE